MQGYWLMSNFKAIELFYNNDEKLIIPSKFIKYLDIEVPNTSHQRIFINFDGVLLDENNNDLLDSFTLLIKINNKFLKYLRKYHKKYAKFNDKLEKYELVNYWLKRKDMVSYILHGNHSTLCEKETVFPLLYEVKDNYSVNDLLNMNTFVSYMYGKVNNSESKKEHSLFCLYLSRNKSDEQNELLIQNLKNYLMHNCYYIECK